MKNKNFKRFLVFFMVFAMILPIFNSATFADVPQPEFVVIVVDSVEEAIAVTLENMESEHFVIIEFTENVDIEEFQTWLSRSRSLSLKVFVVFCWWAISEMVGEVRNRIIFNFTGVNPGDWASWALDAYIAGWRGSQTFPRPCRCPMCQ